MSDAVNHPDHYAQGNIECIDALESCMSPAEFQGMLRGNAIKYLWRCRDKGNVRQDLEKARWYLDKLIEQQESFSDMIAGQLLEDKK